MGKIVNVNVESCKHIISKQLKKDLLAALDIVKNSVSNKKDKRTHIAVLLYEITLFLVDDTTCADVLDIMQSLFHNIALGSIRIIKNSDNKLDDKIKMIEQIVECFPEGFNITLNEFKEAKKNLEKERDQVIFDA
jgi:hypothetical protein